MEAYVYVSGPRDIAEKVAASTDLVPVEVVTAADKKVSINFAGSLRVEEKLALDDFMETRGFTFVEQRTVVSRNRTFEPEVISPDNSAWDLLVSDVGAVTARKRPP